MKTLVKIVVILIVLGLLGGAGSWYVIHHSGPTVTFRTAEVKRSELLATISATGTAEPEEVVDVGAQVAGQILTFGKDTAGKLIDYRSKVDVGTVLAHIDDALYVAALNTAKATLLQAQASVTQADANLLQAKAAYRKADRDWARAQKLGPSEALAQTDYDGYESAYETTKATVAVDEAAIVAAQDNVIQHQALLDTAQENLDYCTIKSPVKGEIIDRRVNIGETVVSSLSTPSLFLIGKDLTHMQIWVSVNEADIGSIHPGQPVTFTVDAFPGRTFVGSVGKIRLNASMTQNVVTYTVEVWTDNSDNTLLPYLTANVQFEVSRHKDVLVVPNAALRWIPLAGEVAPAAAENTEAPSSPNSESTAAPAGTETPAATQPSEGTKAARGGGTTHATTRPAHTHAAGDATTRGTVWVVAEDGLVRPIHVRVGPSDGLNTEIRGKEIKEGDMVVIGEQRVHGAGQGTTNPFVPQIGRPRSTSNNSGTGGSGGSGGGGARREHA